MRIKHFILVLLLWSVSTIIYSQARQLNFVILDEVSSGPVSNAHIFLANTTFGSASDLDGKVHFSLPNALEEDLIISHINYELKLLEHKEYDHLNHGDTLYLNPADINLDEVVISSKRSRKWKKKFKRFREAFLGKDNAAEQCKILNPEVLRFREENGAFLVTANSPLKIKNEYLAYLIDYSLNYLKISENGSIEYLGRAFYKDLQPKNQTEKIKALREEAYLQSSKHFFKCLINSTLAENNYEVDHVIYQDGLFSPIAGPEASELIQKLPGKDIYALHFTHFLRITDKNLKSVEYSSSAVKRGSLESHRFGTASGQELSKIVYAESYIYKIAPTVLLNKFGNVLNTEIIKEYGFWAEQKFAHQLPFDYGNVYEQVKIPFSYKFSDKEKLELLLSLIYAEDDREFENLLEKISDTWSVDYVAPIVELTRFISNRKSLNKVNQLLASKIGFDGASNYYEWLSWLWDQPASYHSYYADFKAELYKHLDPKFSGYFKARSQMTDLRLDEVLWGGVKQDGIPPLRYPRMISANEANYLDEEDIVFGVYIDGEAHAYPKRILGWHEFVVNNISDKTIAGVYCTLCGTMIIYDTEHNGTDYYLGTSGFLYRSNKLIYDQKTQSLWSTIEGKPLIGPLIQNNIELASYPVVTTNWKAWKSLHPDTRVLSKNTGFQRDYSEGAAYRDYYSSDRLMFPVPIEDNRLKNKDEVFVLKSEDYEKDPLAISLDYLEKNLWYQGKINTNGFVVIYEKPGISRAYNTWEYHFKEYKNQKLIDNRKISWELQEEFLLSEDGIKLKRIPAHQVFWFAWINMFPQTRLID